MNSFKRAIKFLNMDLKKSVGYFWGVILFINILSYLSNNISIQSNIGVFYGIFNSLGEEGFRLMSVSGANMFAILVFLIIYMYEAYYESFPMAMGFSCTRKDFYKANMISSLIIVFIFSIIQSILLKVDIRILETIGRNPLTDFFMFNTSKDGILFIFFTLFLYFLCLASIANMLAAINYRFGFKMWFAAAILIPLLVHLRFDLGMWEFFLTIRIDLGVFIKMIAMILITSAIGYIAISTASIKKRLS